MLSGWALRAARSKKARANLSDSTTAPSLLVGRRRGAWSDRRASCSPSDRRAPPAWTVRVDGGSRVAPSVPGADQGRLHSLAPGSSVGRATRAPQDERCFVPTEPGTPPPPAARVGPVGPSRTARGHFLREKAPSAWVPSHAPRPVRRRSTTVVFWRSGVARSYFGESRSAYRWTTWSVCKREIRRRALRPLKKWGQPTEASAPLENAEPKGPWGAQCSVPRLRVAPTQAP